jgi:regulator of protease activity HflC (stomatin/prohibitin superfamily)
MSDRRLSISANVIAAALVALVIVFIVWLLNSTNPTTPAGYVGYVTQGAWLGKARFLDTQVGPTSFGRTWLADVVNVSVTPFTYDEPFDADSTAVLSKDRVRIKFAVHIIFKVKSDSEQIKDFVNKYTTLRVSGREDPNATVKTAYDNFVKEPLRTAARNEVQKLEALQIADNIVEIGHSVEKQIKAICADTPFDIMQVVVGNIQYPDAVANAVANKMAATQKLEQAEIDAKQRITEAEGIAKAMALVQQKLTGLYIQHEAIEAQKALVNSPNHTTIYIPVGPMGVPFVQPTETPATKQ